MVVAYLLFNAVLYLALGVWCTVDPDGTSGSIGYALTNDSARSEYLTVYGGLEVGLALFFAVCARTPSLRRGGLALAFFSYAAIATWRGVSLLSLADPGWFPRTMFPVEAVLAVLGFVLLRRESRAAAT